MAKKAASIPASNDAIEIEKGIPIRSPATGPKTLYPWDKMEVGDSFFVAGERSIIRQQASYQNKGGRKFITRGEGDGIRVWRIG